MNWLITGVSSGLGRALALAALERGDRVAGTVRSEAAKAAFEALAPDLASGFVLDVSDEGAVHRTVAAVEEARMEEVRAQFEVNVFGPLVAIQAVLPFMRARRAGHIVNITSVSGIAPWAGTGLYCGSKFALEGIGQTLAQEVGPLGIKVTNVAPGGLRTDYARRSLTRTALQIDDYDATAHKSRRLLDAGVGRERGDPARAAQAILKVVDSPTPPLRLLLGGDAVHYATRQAGAMQTEMGEWIDLTTSIAFPED